MRRDPAKHPARIRMLVAQTDLPERGFGVRPEIALPQAYGALDMLALDYSWLVAAGEGPVQEGQRACQPQYMAWAFGHPLSLPPLKLCLALMQEMPKLLKVLVSLARHVDAARRELDIPGFDGQVD